MSLDLLLRLARRFCDIEVLIKKTTHVESNHIVSFRLIVSNWVRYLSPTYDGYGRVVPVVLFVSHPSSPHTTPPANATDLYSAHDSFSFFICVIYTYLVHTSARPYRESLIERRHFAAAQHRQPFNQVGFMTFITIFYQPNQLNGRPCDCEGLELLHCCCLCSISGDLIIIQQPHFFPENQLHKPLHFLSDY